MAEENKKEKAEPVKAKGKEKAAKQKKPGLFKRIATYFKETKSELKKVVWPTPKQVVNNTLVVLVVIILSSAFVGIVDSLFKLAASFLT